MTCQNRAPPLALKALRAAQRDDMVSVISRRRRLCCAGDALCSQSSPVHSAPQSATKQARDLRATHRPPRAELSSTRPRPCAQPQRRSRSRTLQAPVCAPPPPAAPATATPSSPPATASARSRRQARGRRWWARTAWRRRATRPRRWWPSCARSPLSRGPRPSSSGAPCALASRATACRARGGVPDGVGDTPRCCLLPQRLQARAVGLATPRTQPPTSEHASWRLRPCA